MSTPTPPADPTPLERPTTLSTQVARHVLDLIWRERLKAGDAAPSELQICRDLGVSRGSVREAYRSLAALGVLEIEGGKRPRLQPINPAVLAEVFGYALHTSQVNASHVVDVRRAIEVQTAQLAARGVTDEQKAFLRARVAEMRLSLVNGDHALRVAADMAIHTTLADASGNPLNNLLLTALRAPLKKLMDLDLGVKRSDVELNRIVDAHEMIVERVCAGDAVGAGNAMAMHFDLSLASMPVPDEVLFDGVEHDYEALATERAGART